MIAWLYEVLIGRFCIHKWKTINMKLLNDNRGVTIGVVYTQQCEKCGKIHFSTFKNYGD